MDITSAKVGVWERGPEMLRVGMTIGPDVIQTEDCMVPRMDTINLLPHRCA
jgi:hypothetical protein